MSGFVSTGDPLIDALLAAGLIGPFVTYSDVSASTVFLYDYLLTLSMEIDLIWRSPWNVIKIIFIIQRYMPFIDTCFLTIYRQLGKLTIAQCEILPYFNGFMYMFGLALSEILLSIRVWAIWDRNMKLAYFQAVLFVIIWSPGFYAMYAYVSSLRYANPPANLLDYRGCFIVDAKEYVLWSWVGVLLWNTVTLTFTLIHSFRSYRAGLVSGLAAVIYRDGAYFYVYLFIFSALNIVFTTTLQPAKRVIVLSLERCLHSMIASRVILHMRAQAKKTDLMRWTTTGRNTTRQQTYPSAVGVQSKDLTVTINHKVPEDPTGYVMHLRRLSQAPLDTAKPTV